MFSLNFWVIEEKNDQHSYPAVLTSSLRSGCPLHNIMPLFIFAGSSDQLEIPMNATRLLFSWSPSSVSSSDPSVPSSSNGWRAFRGILGESSARPTSSNTTTEVNWSRFFSSWKRLHCLKVPIMPSAVDNGLHWYDAIKI